MKPLMAGLGPTKVASIAWANMASMALGPAFYMTDQLPSERRALPVLKVLYRNASRIHATGGPDKEVLHEVPAPKVIAASASTGSRAAGIRQRPNMT